MAANNAQVCTEHDYCECKHYCKDCEKNVCLICTLIGDHSKHNHCPIAQAVTDFRDGVKKTGDTVDEMIKGLDEGYNKIEEMKATIQQQGDDIKNKIDQHYNELEQKLKKQRQQVKQQVSEAVRKKQSTLAYQLTKVEQAKSEVLNMKVMKDTLENNSDQQVLSTEAAKQKQVIDNCLQKLKSNHIKINLEPEEIDNIQFFPSKSLFPLFCSLSVGFISTNSDLLVPINDIYLHEQVTATLLTRDAEGHYCTEGGDQVIMQLETSTGVVTALKVKDNCDGTYVASFEAEQVGVAKLEVSINGLQIRESPYSIVLHNNYQVVKQPNKVFNMNCSMGQPLGVVFGRNGIWAVADCSKHCVYVFDGQDQLVRKIGRFGSGDGELEYPHGVAFDNDNNLYVADGGNRRVQMFDINGNYLLQFGDRGSGDGQLNYPFGITVHNGKVYIADRNNHRVSVFQCSGQFCISFGSDRLGNVEDVAVTINDQLLVVDYSNHCVVTFTLNGQYVGKFGTRGTDRGQLYYPCSLATDVNGFILIGERNSNTDRVSIFDHDGKFIHCFGSHGSANGQFNSPQGIALSPNGSICVSDHKNKRIQIFSTY